MQEELEASQIILKEDGKRNKNPNHTKLYLLLRSVKRTQQAPVYHAEPMGREKAPNPSVSRSVPAVRQRAPTASYSAL
jgi:hypothetical protein